MPPATSICHANKATLPVRERQAVMGLLGAKGGPRNWQVAGMYLDLLGPVESFARTPFRRGNGPFGEVRVIKAEDLLVERVLVSVYPGENLGARECARELAVVSASTSAIRSFGKRFVAIFASRRRRMPRPLAALILEWLEKGRRKAGCSRKQFRQVRLVLPQHN
jgi:hypothetical protein